MVEFKTVARNRRAKFEYDLSEGLEAGIELVGTEVKSVRAGKVSLAEAWVMITDAGEAILKQARIENYEFGNRFNHDPLRERRLLLHRKQIVHLGRKCAAEGYSIVPTQMYLKGGRVKVTIALGKGKKLHDKREAIKRRDADRSAQEAMKRAQRHK
ncbi:MAG: SsrA-binding protein SmpB [Zetaproteobacteria bacterium]|nr:SsrA-binding protein SmpB [Zetaproteobacteria bacterium]